MILRKLIVLDLDLAVLDIKCLISNTRPCFTIHAFQLFQLLGKTNVCGSFEMDVNDFSGNEIIVVITLLF
jgi:hypothetical protein